MGGFWEDIVRDIVGINNKVVIVGEINLFDFFEDNVLFNLISLDGFVVLFNKENGMLGSVKVYGGILRDRFLGVDKFEDRIFVVGNFGSINFLMENFVGVYN